MNVKQKTSFKTLIWLWCALLIFGALGCEKTDLKLGKIYDPTWEFAESSSFEFDQNFISIQNGKASLKTIDLQQTSSDFNAGTYVGTFLDIDGIIRPQISKDVASTHLKSIASGYNNQLLGYWRLDGNGNDENNLLNATTAVAPGFSAGRIGQAATFDGSQYYLLENSSNDMASYTVSLWVLAGPQTTDLNLFHRGAGGFCAYSPVIVFNGTTSEVVVRESGCGGSGEFARETVDRSQWQHLVVTQSNSNSQKLYLNGSLVASGAIDSSANFTGLRTIIGGHIVGGGSPVPTPQFEGAIDEVAIWTTELDAATISSIYTHQAKSFADHTELSSSWTPQFDKIVGYWKLDGNWQDSSGNGNHGTSINAAFLSPDSHVGVGAAQFDAEDDKMSAAPINEVRLENDYSISLWAYLKTEGSIFENSHGCSNRNGISYETGNFEFGYYDSSWTSTSGAGNLNQWNHILAVNRSGVPEIYINGVKGVGSATVYTSCSGLTLGGHLATNMNPDMTGFLDDVAAWSVALNHDEILSIYHRQKQKYAGHYASAIFDMGGGNSNWPDLSWSTRLPFGKELVGDLDSDSLPDAESITSYPLLSSGLMADISGYWSFNEGSYSGAAGEIKDLSGNSADGMTSGAVSSTSEHCQFNRCIGTTAGNKDIIFPNRTNAATTDVTTSIWLRLYSQPSGGQYQVIRQGSGIGRMWLLLSTSGGMNANSYFGPGKDYYVGGSKFVADGKWHHVVVTYDRDSLTTLYVDGEVDNTIDMSGASTDSWDLASSLNLLVFPFSIRVEFEGQIDEFATWNRALSLEEVQSLYRRGANRIKFQVKSCIDSNCNCKSFNTSPQGSSTDCDGDFTLNAVDTDDIHKASFMGPGGDGTTYYSELLNRDATDFSYNCALNTSDSDAGVCVNDEFTFARSADVTGPSIAFNEFPISARPTSNRFIQYRLQMEADNNTACSGSPCLPGLAKVNLRPGQEQTYSGGLQEIKPKASVAYKEIRSASISADECASFQLSPNGTDYYYWNTSSWSLVSSESDRSSQQEVESFIVNYSMQFGPGNLFIKSFLQTNAEQSSDCSITNIDLSFSRQ